MNSHDQELYLRFDLGRTLALEQGIESKADIFAFAMAFVSECTSMPMTEAVDMCFHLGGY